MFRLGLPAVFNTLKSYFIFFEFETNNVLFGLVSNLPPRRLDLACMSRIGRGTSRGVDTIVADTLKCL